MIDSYWVVRDSDQDISHYGVKGMKWGVRRYQNEDGTLTSLGRRREDLKDAQQRHVKGKQAKFQKRVDVGYATREFNKEKTRQRINAKGYKKTKRQLANEKKYRDQGFTNDEAEIMAANRRRGVRIAMAAGGIAIAALGAYAAYRHYDRITDRLLSAGSELGRVGITDSEGLREGFYAFRKGIKRDATNYEGMYAKTLSEGGRKVFRKSINATSDIKIASDRRAQKVLAKLLENDEDARREVEFGARTITKRQELAERLARRDLRRGKYDSKHVYDLFNMGIAGIGNEKREELNKNFYEELKKQGYGAVRDVNDTRFSGYRSKDPLIFFDTAKVATTKVSELSNSEINKKNAKAMIRNAGITLAGQGVLGYAVNKGMRSVNTKFERSIVRRYRKEHPNSEMTDSEILKSLNVT